MWHFRVPRSPVVNLLKVSSFYPNIFSRFFCYMFTFWVFFFYMVINAPSYSWQGVTNSSISSTISNHMFTLSQVLDPEKQGDLLDSLRICLLQFSTLLVEHAPHHIHDNNKSRNSKLRRLMTFAWPCLLPKACVDPACKYSGHLLLAHIIAKFAIHKKIVLQVRKNFSQ